MGVARTAEEMSIVSDNELLVMIFTIVTLDGKGTAKTIFG
jgi:hypothetical protein